MLSGANSGLLYWLVLLLRQTECYMYVLDELSNAITASIQRCYPTVVMNKAQLNLQQTRNEFSGDFTLVTFPLAKSIGDKPPAIAERIGRDLYQSEPMVAAFEVVKGFLNLQLSTAHWIRFLNEQADTMLSSLVACPHPQTIMVEYSSPNTNKPLHLGHIRNNLLGYSLAQVLQARGHHVIKANLINDRGIHICKSMLAYQRFGNGETPQSTGEKGDHLVGRYYVRFDEEYRKEMQQMVAKWAAEDPLLQDAVQEPTQLLKQLSQKENHESLNETEKNQLRKLRAYTDKAEKEAPLMAAAQQMLQQWEQGDEKTVALWKTMNNWVYEGFKQTYQRLGVDFQAYYYESETYLPGKEIVDEGLKKRVFHRREDHSVWADLTNEGLDEKLLLRSDGTSVYITQDLGTAELKYKDYHFDQSVYVVGNEQEYHFKVLRALLQKLEKPYAERIYHLSYGMVDLPGGKMKSREGTVVDADDLIDEVTTMAGRYSEESGKLGDLSQTQRQQLHTSIGLAALKFFLLKTEPKKRLLFNPEEEIDFHGHTGPFVQYTHARICSVLRKHREVEGASLPRHCTHEGLTLQPAETELLRLLSTLPEVLAEAEKQMNPAAIANHAFEMAKSFNRFYHLHSILHEKDDAQHTFRLVLANEVRRTLAYNLELLGIQAPEKM